MDGNVENTAVLLKQRKAIAVLKKDNAALKEELRLENKHSVVPTAASGSALLAQLQSESDILTRKIGVERSKLADSQERCKVLQKKVERQRLSMGGLTAAHRKTVKASRTVKQQENRLQVAWQTRNEALSATADLRGRVEGLRRERLGCTEVLRKSDAALEDSRSSLAVLLTESVKAAAQRDTVLAETQALQVKVSRLVSKSELEWNQLSHLIQQDRQARELARQADIDERDRRTHALIKAEIGSQRRATAVGWGLARNKAAQNASTSRMAQLSEDFAAVQAATGTESPAALAQQLKAAEDTKFRMFTFINELNAELEVLEAQISTLQAELAHARAEAERQHERKIADSKAFEAAVKAATDEAEAYERRAGAALHRVAGLRAGVAELFAAAECDATAVSDLLGTDGVTATNVMQHLGIIEHKILELVQVIHSDLQAPNEVRTGPKPATRARVQAVAPKAGSVNEVLLIEPPPAPLAGQAELEGPEEGSEPLLDRKALFAAAERSLHKRLQEANAPSKQSTAKSGSHR